MMNRDMIQSKIECYRPEFVEGKQMNRTELKQYILSNYNVKSDCPWISSPNHEVFRHSNNRKWFALIMDVPKNKLGLQGTEELNVVNLKCDPILIGSLRNEIGFFPAYHMSKDNWITVALDGSASDDRIKMLLDMSYGATAPKMRKNRP
jgi:predicted DNA-binding protein (MmcQ/YjbR family)